MKKFFFLLVSSVLVLFLGSCTDLLGRDPANSQSFLSGIPFKLIILFIVGLYELVVRLIPSIGSWSLLALIIKILKYISDYLQRKPVKSKPSKFYKNEN
jgi:hypothetical protein